MFCCGYDPGLLLFVTETVTDEDDALARKSARFAVAYIGVAALLIALANLALIASA